ncbi:MAG: tetratricopeptide repeat protein, partial [Methanotrichaceae archaeon]|nr:tetratricopeptide repeat protein [Methanotrichaceae archaeon]
GRIDENICSKLADCLDDVYEIKRLGDICRRAGLYSLAIRCYNKALSITRDQNVRPVLLNNLGQVYARQGDPGRATIFYQKAADGFESIGDQSGLAHILGNLGAAHRRAKNWDKAVEHCYRSLKIFEDTGDVFGVAQMTGSLGRIYAEMGERDLATRYFEKSLKDFQRLGDKKNSARILDRMGRICAEGRRWDDAIRYYSKSLSLFDEIGQSQSSGIVLSNLGRMHLEKGDAVSARDSLERALKLIRRETQPAYQNAVASMAATYSLMAHSYLEEAEPFGPMPAQADRKDNGTLKLASQYFARASDRYQELSTLPKTNLPQIRVAAAVSRSLSYLSSLKANPTDAVAVNLAERAISALDNAVANSEGPEKIKIEALQRVLTGMKEVWSAGLLESEPWRMTKPLGNAAEYMLGGACSTGEANSCLCDALRALCGAIEAERQRGDPIEQLKSAASHLRRAENRLKASKAEWSRQSAMQICEATQLIEGLISQEIGKSAASQSRISDLLSYKAHRGALLLIGWVMANEALYVVDKTSHVFAWDEAFNLVERSSDAKGTAGLEIETTAGIETAAGEAEQEAEREADQDVEPVPFQEALERRIETADPTEGQEPITAAVAVDDGSIAGGKSNPDGLWLIPVKAGFVQSSGSSQMLMAPATQASRSFALEEIEIVDPAAEVQTEMVEDASESMGMIGLEKENYMHKDDSTGFGKAEAKTKSVASEAAGDATNDPIGDARKELRALKDWLSGLLGGIFTVEMMVKVIKALLVV